MTLQEMHAAFAALVAEMEALDKTAAAEDRDFNAEELKAYDAAKEKATSLDKRIKRAEELADMKKPLESSRGAVSRGAAVGQPLGEPAKKEFESLGEFMHAALLKPSDQRLSYFEPNQIHGEQRMDTGSSGGFMVPQQFRSQILQVDPQQAIIRPRAFVIPAGNPPDAAITMPALDQTGSAPDNMFGGVSMSWTGEGGTIPETGASFREITMQPTEASGHIKLTDKLLRNWEAATPTLERLFRAAAAAYEDREFFSANGVGKPLGIINSGAAYAVNRGVSNTISFDDVNSMFARIKMGGSPVWIASQSILPQLTGLRNYSGSPAVGNGELVWHPKIDGKMAGTLLGIPLFISERSPALGSKGDLVLTDLQYYLIKDGSGPFVASDGGIVNFTSNKTLVKIFWNVAGQPWLNAPLTLENGYQVSPFVVLDVP